MPAPVQLGPIVIPGTSTLLRVMAVVLVVTHLAQFVTMHLLGWSFWSLALLDPSPSIAWVWQPWTHIFVDGISGLAVLFRWLFVYFVLVSWGRIEQQRGTWFCVLAMIAGLVAGSLLAMGWMLLAPSWSAPSMGPAVLFYTALGVTASDRTPVSIWFFGPTAPTESYKITLAFLLFSLIISFGNRDLASFFEVVGGTAAGYLVATRGDRGRRTPPPKKKAPPHLRAIRGGKDDDAPPYLN